MKKLTDSLTKVTKQLSQVMTAEMRASALDHGWSNEAAFGTDVMFENGQLTVSIHPQVESKVMDLEYGTTSSRPTAVLRKYGNSTQKIEKALISSLEKEIGFKL